MSPEVEALIKKIGEEGDKVRQLKSSGADKVCTETRIKYFHEMIYSVAGISLTVLPGGQIRAVPFLVQCYYNLLVTVMSNLQYSPCYPMTVISHWFQCYYRRKSECVKKTSSVC
jgi:hypothetical protein